MKKSIITLLCATLIAPAANAAFLQVETITPFSTDNPPESVELKSLGEVQLTKDVKIEKEDIIYGNLTDIKAPKRLKRDATFSIDIKSVQKADGKCLKPETNTVASYISALKIDKKKFAKNAVLTVGNHFATGISAGYHAIEGAVDNRSDGVKGMAKGAVTDVYDNSPLGYTKKGKELSLQSGEKFFLKVRSEEEFEKANAKAEKDAPNYTYETPAEEN